VMVQLAAGASSPQFAGEIVVPGGSAGDTENATDVAAAPPMLVTAIVRGFPDKLADSAVLFTASASDETLALSVGVAGAGALLLELPPKQPEPTMPGTMRSRKYANIFFKASLDSAFHGNAWVGCDE